MSERKEIAALVWDEWNEIHVLKHGMNVDQVIEVVFGSTIHRDTYKGRTKITGPDSTGKVYTVIVGPSPGKTGHYYVFSARPANRSERRDFEAEKGGSVT